MSFIYWFLFIVLISVVFGAISANKDMKKRKIKDIQRQKRRAERRNELDTITIPDYNKSRTSLINKFGNPTKTIMLGQYDLRKEIIVFDESKRVWICGKDFPMESIISCTLKHDREVIKGKVTYTTKTKSGNMVKRAVGGAILLGPAGALIGGSTARKSTVSTQGDDIVRHNYTVLINVNSFSEPIIRPYSGRNDKLAKEIVGLMNVIVNRNQRTVVGEK